MDTSRPDIPGAPGGNPCGARRAGRPRSEACRVAVLNAAYDVLASDGLASFTIERVAAAAAVGRNTIYRWWPSRGVLAVECLLDAVRKQPRPPFTGNVIEDLGVLVRQVIGIMRGEGGRIIAGIVADSQSDSGTLAAFEDGYVRPRRLEFERVLAAGVSSGQLRPDLDVGMTIDLLIGALLYRQLIRGGLDDPRLADRVVASVVSGCSAAAGCGDGDRPAAHRS